MKKSTETTVLGVLRRKPKPVAVVDFDEATYVGDEDDGVYFQVGKKGKNFYVSTTVDCNTSHFIQDLRTDDGPFKTEAEAAAHGRSVAEEWCFNNQVEFEPANNQTAKLMEKYMVHL
jgi:hypothetical protein